MVHTWFIYACTCCHGTHYNALANKDILKITSDIIVIIRNNVVTTPLICVMLSLSLGVTRRFLMVLLPLTWTCIPTLLQIFLKLLLRPWYMVQPCGCCCSCLGCFLVFLVLILLPLEQVWSYVVLYLWLLLVLSQLRDHVGYLHLIRASLMYSSSLCSSSGLAQTVLALCVRVLNTLYLTDKVWWLSQCKYLSVLVGFL